MSGAADTDVKYGAIGACGNNAVIVTPIDEGGAVLTCYCGKTPDLLCLACADQLCHDCAAHRCGGRE